VNRVCGQVEKSGFATNVYYSPGITCWAHYNKAQTAGAITGGVIAGVVVGGAVFAGAASWGARKAYIRLHARQAGMGAAQGNPLYEHHPGHNENPLFQGR